jgi:glycosyltransferase involved in cell wall biosynthesis
VNSDFVKRTFTICGYDPTKLSVVHWGVDARFLEASDHALKRGLPRKPALDLLFCGGFGQRKGALQLMNALALADDMPWTLTIAGGIEADAQPAWADFITRYRHRVRHLGILPREELAGLMAQFRVFVFPTLMEGSARVVFEALASGCFVITTPHAGSVVEDQINGLLLPPGDATLLAEAIRSLATGDRDLDGAGIMNRMLVRTSYRQDQYADKVLRVYEHVMSGQ